MTTFKALAALFGLIIIGIVIIVLGNQSSTPSTGNPRTDKTTSVEMQATITKDSTADNVNVYTSPTLGITFTYAAIDPVMMKYNGTSIPVEITQSNNTLQNSTGGKVTVYAKDLHESLKDAVQHLVFDPQTSYKNCSLVSGESWNTNLDQTIYLATAAGDIETQDNPTSDCPTEYVGPGVVFAASSSSPDRFIMMEFSTQDPGGVLSWQGDSFTTWLSTINILPR